MSVHPSKTWRGIHPSLRARAVEFGRVKSTRCARLSYQKQGDCWRIIDNATENVVGPQYRSERELLADFDRFVANFGF